MKASSWLLPSPRWSTYRARLAVDVVSCLVATGLVTLLFGALDEVANWGPVSFWEVLRLAVPVTVVLHLAGELVLYLRRRKEAS